MSIRVSKLLTSPAAHSSNAQTLLAMNFLGKPLLTVPNGKTLEIGSQSLVNHKLGLFFHDLHLTEALGEDVSKDPSKQDTHTHDEEGQGLVTRGVQIVLRCQRSRLVHQRDNLGLENLHVAHAPVAEKTHNQGSKLHQLKRSLVQFIVVHGRLLVVVSDQELVTSVVQEESDCSNWEQLGKAAAIHESNANCVHQGRVFVRHHVFGTSV